MPFIEVEESRKNYNWSMNDLHCHDYYEVYFLLEGSREIFLRNNIYSIEKNTILIIPPYAMHKTEGPAFVRVNINVSPNYFSEGERELVSAVAGHGAIQFDDLTAQQIRELILKIKSCYDNLQDGKSAAVLHTLVCCLFVIIQSKLSVSDEPQKNFSNKQLPLLLIKSIRYINEHLSEPLSVKMLADALYVSSGYLAKLFKKHTNCSLSEYMLNLRITAAKEYLCTSKKNIEEISSLTGFSSANYFSLIFKRRVGFSPLAYRKNQSSNIGSSETHTFTYLKKIKKHTVFYKKRCVFKTSFLFY